MAEYCEFEIDLEWRAAGSYGLSARFSRPDSDADVRLLQEELVAIDVGALAAQAVDPIAYGNELGKLLLGAPAVAKLFGEARAAAEAASRSLRLRLSIGANARDLHGLRWETLRDPASGDPIATRETLPFSRYLSSLDWRPVPLRSRGQLRALVAIANPSDLKSRYELEPVAVEAELARAKAALGDLPTEVLAKPGEATVDGIAEKLREGFDVFYLVCHGTLVDGDPRLWLEDSSGKSARVRGSDLVVRMEDAKQRPRLVVLASCQSGGTGEAEPGTADEGALVALGPRLARAGVPAVVAMQGNVTMQTIGEFMPSFFKELLTDGQVDRAMAVARGRVRNRPDWWIPVLFSRLRSGRLWFDQGFGTGVAGGGFDRWESIVNDIAEQGCIPLLGQGLVEPLIGNMRDIARYMADQFDFPLAPRNRDELAQVAQYLAYRQNRTFARSKVAEAFKTYILSHHGARVPPELAAVPTATLKLNQLISAVGTQVRAQDPNDAHKRLAALPFPIYVCASRDNLLFDALVEAGKKPRYMLARWNDSMRTVKEDRFQWEKNYEPDAQNPVILHLFGNLEYPESLVLSEDDYFQFLTGVARSDPKRPAIPTAIASRLATSGLLFLGFNLDDWDFRVLFRSIIQQEGDALSRDHTRVAVQVNPAEGTIIDTAGTRKYLERFFQKGQSYGMFWGSADEFLDGLVAQAEGKL